MNIIGWWNSLGLAAQIFYCIALPSTLLLLIQTVLLFLGIGDDSDGPGDLITDNMPDDMIADDLPDVDDGIFDNDIILQEHDVTGLDGLRIFTIKGIIAFLVVFGWVGVVMESAGIALWITLLVSIACGFAMMVLLAILFRAVWNLRNDGNTDNRNAIGIAGKVHLTIPPSRTGEGKVHVMLQGSYVERDAVTDDSDPIRTGSEIVVTGVSGQTTLVVRRK